MITPTGRLSIPLHQMRTIINESPAWSEWLGVGVVALDRIHVQSVSADAPRPFAILAWSGDLSGVRDGVAVNGFARSGSVVVGIDADVPEAESLNDIDALTGFMNRLDALLSDIENAPNYSGSGLTITDWSIIAGPDRIPKEQRGKHGDRIQVDVSFSVESWP